MIVGFLKISVPLFVIFLGYHTVKDEYNEGKQQEVIEIKHDS